MVKFLTFTMLARQARRKDVHMTGQIFPDSKTEANKSTVKRILEQLSEGNIRAFTDTLLPNYVRHCQAMPPGLQEIYGPEAMYQWLISNQTTFPDYREELESMVAEGDFVAWRSKGSGTQCGPLGPFPATGKRMEITIIGMHRFEGTMIAETWTSWDNLAALMQLELLPGV
jgi:predicted ester cyclase